MQTIVSLNGGLYHLAQLLHCIHLRPLSAARGYTKSVFPQKQIVAFDLESANRASLLLVVVALVSATYTLAVWTVRCSYLVGSDIELGTRPIYLSRIISV